LRRHGGASESLLSTATIAFCILIIGTLTGEASGSVQPPEGEPIVTRIRVTGRGHAPRRAMSDSQSRLMAKRAAMVEAYKNMAKALGKLETRVVDGTGYESVSGFIEGIELKETRYYPNRDVEVDIELVAPIQSQSEEPQSSQSSEGNLKREKPILIEKGGARISESEWKKIFGTMLSQ
jgi:hypothetical protein